MVTVNIKAESKQGIYLALFLQELAKTEPSIIEYSGNTEDELLVELLTIKENEISSSNETIHLLSSNKNRNILNASVENINRQLGLKNKSEEDGK